MGGALRRPTKFDGGAALQQSSNIFYQKFLKIDSVSGCGEEKGFKGKRNRRNRLRFSLSRLAAASLPAKFSRRLKVEGERKNVSLPRPPVC